MWNLVEQAVSQGLIRQERAENVLAAVELRNSWLHVSGEKVISPGMAEQVIAESHAVIVNLYTDRAGAASDAAE